MSLTLRDLEYFIEILSTGSMSRAAERLGVTQPALTTAMQRFEEAVGAPLLLRSKRGVTPTVAGKLIAERARRLADSWRRLCDDALASREQVMGRYVLGCHTVVASYTLPYALPALLQAHPNLHLVLVHDLSRKIVEQTISMQIDVAVVINPVRHPDLIVRKIRNDVVTLWRSPQTSALQALDGTGVLLCDPDLLQTQALQRKLTARRLQFARTVTSPSLEVVADLTSGGVGVGILPASLALQSGLIAVTEAPTYRDELCIVYRVESRSVPAVLAIAESVASALGRAQLRAS